MTTLTETSRVSYPEPEELLPLENGDHLDRATFHARYEAMPRGVKAELVGGVVYMPSPVTRKHGKPHLLLATWLGLYEAATPGVEGLDNATAILGEESEPQPDLSLVISPEHGGQTSVDAEDYITGAPELVVEVASSTAAYDLHQKKTDYERAGVREYLVVLVRRPQVLWFVNRDGTFKELAPGEDGIYRSEVFPGLWLDPAALLRLDGNGLRATLEQGLASEAHAAFVTRLAAGVE